MSWEADVPGEVVGWQRAGRDGRSGRTFTPRRTRLAEDRVRSAWAAAHGDACLVPLGPVAVEVHIYRPLPASRPKRVLAEPDCVKPDADNVAKAVLDALGGLAYRDDAQVTWLLVHKHDRTRRDGGLLHIKVDKL